MNDKDDSANDCGGPEEGRKAPRRRQLKSAALIFNDHASVIDCRLRDISDSGAGIECENTQQVPENVILKVGDGTFHHATVAWRTPTKLGLRFEENPEVIRLLEHLSRLYGELAPPLAALVRAADDVRQGGRGSFGHPRVDTHLQNIAVKGRSFCDSFDAVVAEFGPAP